MDIPSWFGLLMAVASFVGGIVMWYKGSVEKRYAARRDFDHLKRNYAQVTTAVQQLDDDVQQGNEKIIKELSEMRGSINEMKVILQFMMAQQGGTSQGMPLNPNSQFHTRRD